MVIDTKEVSGQETLTNVFTSFMISVGQSLKSNKLNTNQIFDCAILLDHI